MLAPGCEHCGETRRGFQCGVDSSAYRGASADWNGVARNPDIRKSGRPREDFRVLGAAAVVYDHNCGEQSGDRLQQMKKRFRWLVCLDYQRYHAFLRANFKPVQSSSTAQIL
jgi:hypothetical protein